MTNKKITDFTKLLRLRDLASNLGYEIRHYTKPLKASESFDKAIKPFDFSEQNGGTLDAFKYYNDFYLYPTGGTL